MTRNKDLLSPEEKKKREQAWKEENKEAIDYLNEFTRIHGSFSDSIGVSFLNKKEKD